MRSICRRFSCNTGFTGHKNSGVTGHLYEDWSTARVGPYGWLETGQNNTTTESSEGMFVLDNGTLKTTGTSDRNYHFTGPGMSGTSNYTITGKLRVGDASAEFGINFYSQWPDESKKYSLVRQSDGKFTVRAYSDASTYTTVATTQDVYADSTGKW